MSKQKELEQADAYFEKGKQLSEQAKHTASNQALAQASTLYAKWKEWEKWTATGNEIGWNEGCLGNFQQGIEHLEKVLLTAKKHLHQEHIEITESYNHLGTCYCSIGQYEKAQLYYEQSLAIRRKRLGESHVSVASSWNNLGICLELQGDFDTAIAYHKTALEIRISLLGEENMYTTSSWNNLGVCFEGKRDDERALEAYQKVLTICRKLLGTDEHLRIASCLNNIGSIYRLRGDYEHALSYFQQALHIKKKIWGKDHLDIGVTLMNIGNCYNEKKDNDRAIEYHEHALRIYQKFMGKEHIDVARILQNIGNCYAAENKLNQAIQLHKSSLNILKKSLGDAHPEIATATYNVSLTYYLMNDYQQSIHYGQQALELRKKLLNNNHPDIAHDYNCIGKCHLAQKQYALAIHHFQQAIVQLIPSFAPKDAHENPTLTNVAGSYLLLESLQNKAIFFHTYYTDQTQNPKDLQTALETCHIATKLIAKIRQSYKAEGSKHTLAEITAKIYHLAIQLSLKMAESHRQNLPSLSTSPSNISLATQSTKEWAFNFSEQSKAILLLSSLKDSDAKTSSNIPIDLLAKEKQLKIELNFLDRSIAHQSTRGNQKDETLLSKFHIQYFDYKQEYDQLIEQFESEYPEYYRLKYAVKTVLVEEIQRYLRKSNQLTTNNQSTTQLISYHISEKSIYIFSITSNDYQIQTVDKPSNFIQLLEEFRGVISFMDIEDYIDSARTLFDLLLKPILESIETSQKLIIIPHNELTTLPFGALIDTRKLTPEKCKAIIENGDFSDLPYLVKDYEISYHYSITMLLHSVARQEKKPPKPASFIGFAPVHFDGSEDTQLALASSRGQTKILRSNHAGETALSQLPNTENEVKEVFQLFEEKQLEAKAFLYASANKQNLIENISNHKYVLIATHGYAKDGNTGLSGIYLAPQKSEARSQETGDSELEDTHNGYRRFTKTSLQEPINTQTHKNTNTNQSYILHTSEAYHLQLDADLVVLSSCSSGVGKLVRGEGMMAINRGFLYAGASNIIFTHFDIPDASSGELVKALFEQILEGESYASALRKAKLEVIQQDLKTPEDWAGYALIGG